MSVANRFLKKLSVFEQENFAWLCYLFLSSLFFSRAGLAISGILLLAYSIAYYFKHRFKVSLKPLHILLFAIYAAYLISVFFASEDVAYGWRLLFKNAMFVTLPLAFLFSEELSSQAVRRCFLLYLLVSILCVSINTVDALMHFNQFLEDVGNSKNIIPILGPGHSELGVLSTVAFIMGFFLLKSTKSLKHKLWLLSALAVLFVELHILAYRFSLIALYLLIICYATSELIKRRSFKLFLLTIVVSCGTFYLLSLVPSVKGRIQSTINDFGVLVAHKNPNFQSVTQRVLAISCATEVIKKHPWLGVSPANASQEMQEQYIRDSYLLIPENRIFIHNQFVYYILCFGIPIGLLFGASWVVLVLRNSFVNPILFWMMLPFLLHMMVENTLERQISANAFIFLFLFLEKNGKCFMLKNEKLPTTF